MSVFLAFNEHAEESARESIVVQTDELRLFQKVVDFFPESILVGETDCPPDSTLLTLNAFQILLAGGRIALTGHASAMFPVLRTALESACYAFMIIDQPDLAEVWRDRHMNRTKMEKCRKTFSGAVQAVARTCSWTAEGKQHLVNCYQSMIDFGGHPNPYSVYRAVSVADSGDYWAVSIDPIREADSEMTRWATLACADTGLCIAAVLAECFRKDDRAAWDRITSMTGELQALQAKDRDAPDSAAI